MMYGHSELGESVQVGGGGVVCRGEVDHWVEGIIEAEDEFVAVEGAGGMGVFLG